MADELEITEQSTPEDVAAYAEAVVKEVESERAGETKGDAQIASEHAGPPPKDKTPNKTSTTENNASSDDTAEVDDRSEDSGKKEASWLDDDLKAEAAAYGIDESELADFASREEFERALRIFDKSALDAGRKALASGESDKGPERNEKGQFAKKDEPEPEPPKRDGRYEVTLDTDIYDDEIVAEFNRMRDHYDDRVARLEARFAETDALAEEQRFDGFVDSLGHTDLFGKTGSESPQELQRRQDLLVAGKAQQIGLQQLGRPTELNEFLVNRVARMVFADELGKKDLKQRTRKISRQSNARQGGGATRPQDPREDPRDEFDRLYRQLDRA